MTTTVHIKTESWKQFAALVQQQKKQPDHLALTKDWLFFRRNRAARRKLLFYPHRICRESFD